MKNTTEPAREMVLNPTTGKWEIEFTYIQTDGNTYVELGKKQREYIETRISTTPEGITQNAITRLQKILKNGKYTLSDRSWMNYQFNRSTTK